MFLNSNNKNEQSTQKFSQRNGDSLQKKLFKNSIFKIDFSIKKPALNETGKQ